MLPMPKELEGQSITHGKVVGVYTTNPQNKNFKKLLDK